MNGKDGRHRNTLGVPMTDALLQIPAATHITQRENGLERLAAIMGKGFWVVKSEVGWAAAPKPPTCANPRGNAPVVHIFHVKMQEMNIDGPLAPVNMANSQIGSSGGRPVCWLC